MSGWVGTRVKPKSVYPKLCGPATAPPCFLAPQPLPTERPLRLALLPALDCKFLEDILVSVAPEPVTVPCATE